MRKFQKENPNFSKNLYIFFNLIKIIRKKIYDKETFIAYYFESTEWIIAFSLLVENF